LVEKYFGKNSYGIIAIDLVILRAPRKNDVYSPEEGGVADYNNMDSTIDVPSTPTLRIHKIHPQSQIIGKSTDGVQTRRKLQDSTSNQHQALLSFIYKQVEFKLGEDCWEMQVKRSKYC
ncbi:hypothetical protein Tco_0357998, partial [Tanacetum coccineum]